MTDACREYLKRTGAHRCPYPEDRGTGTSRWVTCTGCAANVCTATPDAPEEHRLCIHGAVWGSSPA